MLGRLLHANQQVVGSIPGHDRQICYTLGLDDPKIIVREFNAACWTPFFNIINSIFIHLKVMFYEIVFTDLISRQYLV